MRQIPNPFSYNFLKGGPGSGNFNHSGRPGEIGGSAEESGGKSKRVPDKTQNAAANLLTAFKNNGSFAARLSNLPGNKENLVSNTRRIKEFTDKLYRQGESFKMFSNSDLYSISIDLSAFIRGEVLGDKGKAALFAIVEAI